MTTAIKFTGMHCGNCATPRKKEVCDLEISIYLIWLC
jgi:copper chaperone CopZ